MWTSQLQGPQVGLPHQPRGHCWSILEEGGSNQSEEREPLGYLSDPALFQPGSPSTWGPKPLTCAHSGAQNNHWDSHKCSRGGLLGGGGRILGSDRGSRDRHPHNLGRSNLQVGPESPGHRSQSREEVGTLLPILHLLNVPLLPAQISLPLLQSPPGWQVQEKVCQRSWQSAWAGQGPDAQELVTVQPGSTFTRWLGASRGGDPDGVVPSQTPYRNNQPGAKAHARARGQATLT